MGERTFNKFMYEIQDTLINNARAMSRVPFIITSACRCENWNFKQGGKPNSAHRTGEAVDIQALSGRDKFAIVRALLKVGFRRIGIGSSFVHADISESLPQNVIWTY